MGINSIRHNMTKDSIISEIKLLLGADIYSENVYVVVEGQDDIKFLRRFFQKNIILYESYSGKSGVETIVNSNEFDDSAVIGIRDKDYCRDIESERIFFYDRCCLEMMIIEFDEAFNTIYCEFYNGEMQPNKLKEHILTELFKVSQVRKYNEENKKGINFKGLSFQSIINDKSKMDEKKLIEQLKKLNSGKSINCINIIDESLYQNTDNLLDITNGHDFILLFKVICDKMCSKKSPNANHISSVLRSSFNEKLLKETTLYRSISDYFDNNVKIWCC